MPSTKSAVPAQAAKLVASASSCSDNVRASDSRTSRFALRNASTGPVASAWTTAFVAASSSAAGTTRLTMPSESASARAEALAQQEDLHGLADADEARQRPRSTAVRRERDLPVRGREIGVVGGNDKIAGVHQRQAEPGDSAVDAADDRMRHAVQMLDRRMQASDHAREAFAARGRRFAEPRGERPDVAAGHEVPPRAAQHDDAQAVVAGDRRRVRDEGLDHRGSPAH